MYAPFACTAMTSILNVLESSWTETYCPYTPTFFTPYLLFFYFAHSAITFVIFVVGIVRRELYLLLLSFSISLAYAENYLLKWIFMQPIPFPGCGTDAVFCVNPSSAFTTCGAMADPCIPCGMPALEPHLSAFTVVSVALFGMQWRWCDIRFTQIATLIGLYTLVMVTHLYFSFNTVEQVVVGAAAGSLTALARQLFLFAVIYPYFDQILRWKIMRRFGYGDSLCRTTYPPGDDAEHPEK